MQLKENLVEALIGAAVLVVAGLFVSYAYTRTEAGQGAGGYTLNARFDSAGGLSVGTDVRISGIKVGTVTAMPGRWTFRSRRMFIWAAVTQAPVLPAEIQQSSRS